MLSLITPTFLGWFLITGGAIAWIAAILRIANLEINLKTPKGRGVFIFVVLHFLVGLMILIIDKLS
ncbi:MAG: hypothetical protein SAL70_40145 [Scytonema sp. PMC 1070.18]|nr:hypothetical protein [Scytonema sp. PMC 1070.18]